ncbi:MAG TPA: hypothetical protein VK570_04025 [Rubrivivax sp.]|nr:hypothetical protein [Rubrivivax sp.]
MKNHLMARAAALALGFALLASARGKADDPSEARTPAGPLRYDSAFAGYRPWQDAKPGNWRAINDALLREPPAQAAPHAESGAVMPDSRPDASPAAGRSAVAPAAAASGPPHGGHGQHGRGGHR